MIKRPNLIDGIRFKSFNNDLSMFLKNGGDINSFNLEGNTLLIEATQLKAKSFVALLIAKGADVNLQNKENRTPLSYAKWWKNFQNGNEIINLLEKYGAKDE
jgi:ankyrin repeat protein